MRTLTPIRSLRFATVGRRLLIAGAIVLGLAVAFFAVVQARFFLYHSPYFAVRTITIEGVSKPIEERMRDRLSALAADRNLLWVSAAALERDLRMIPEIRDLVVTRQFPDAIDISASERRPALVVLAGVPILVDREFVAICEADSETFLTTTLPIITRDASTPIRFGEVIREAGLLRSWTLLTALRELNPTLSDDVAEVHYNGQGEVTLTMIGGTECRLGTRAPHEVLPVLEALANSKPSLRDMEYAELRFKDQVSWKLAAGVPGVVPSALDSVPTASAPRSTKSTAVAQGDR